MNNRIAVVASSIHPVKQRHLLDWYESLKSRREDIVLFVNSTSVGLRDVRRLIPGSSFLLGIYFIRNLLLGRVISLESLRISPLLDFRPTLIHLLTAQAFVTIAPILKNEKVGLIVSFRGFDINVFPHQSDGNMNAIRRAFDRATILHFISNDLRAKAIGLGANPSKCVVIHRSFDASESYLMRGSIQRSSQENIILTVGRLVWEKGYLYALEALSLLKKRGYEFTYFIVGDGIDRNQLTYHIVRLDLAFNVVLLGELLRDKVVELYLKATIYLQPSISEGLCNAVMEASYYSLPIVAFRTGGIPEIVEDHQSGLLSETYDVNGLSTALQRFIDDPELRESMGKNAHARVTKYFKRSDEIDEWLKLYENLPRA